MTAPAGHVVAVELLSLSVLDGVLRYRVSRTVLPRGATPDQVAARAAGDDLSGPGVVLHSTSWRFEEGPVLTYAAFPVTARTTDRVFGEHVVTGPDALTPTPPHVSLGHVAAHAVRHLADLADGRDPHVTACTRGHGRAAWEVLRQRARSVHVDDQHAEPHLAPPRLASATR